MGIKKDGWISIKDIKKNPSNPRIIKDKGFNKLQDSLSSERGKEHFEARPCIVSNRTGENIIIAGNTRYQAAKDLGWEEVPCVILENLTEEQENEIIIRDNVSNGEWDWEELANAWDHESLLEWGLELPDTIELEPEEVKEDDYNEEPPKEPVTKRGDIYELGEHRVMCGDSTMIDDVERLMNGEKADMVFTDPPYGISIVSSKTGKVGAGNLAKTRVYSEVIGDDTTDTTKEFYLCCISCGFDKYIIWGGNYFVDFLPFSDGWIIWDKRGEMNSNNFADGEMAWCSFHTPVRIYKQIWNGMIREGESEARVHPTQKPVKMLGNVLSDFTKKDENVLDGFLGSGSTLIACEQTNRKCYGMELDEKYCDVIVRRYIKYCRDNEKEPIVKLNGEVLNNLEMYE